MNVLEFLKANYPYIIVVILLIIITTIGFLADRNRNGKKSVKNGKYKVESPDSGNIVFEQGKNNEPQAVNYQPVSSNLNVVNPVYNNLPNGVVNPNNQVNNSGQNLNVINSAINNQSNMNGAQNIPYSQVNQATPVSGQQAPMPKPPVLPSQGIPANGQVNMNAVRPTVNAMPSMNNYNMQGMNSNVQPNPVPRPQPIPYPTGGSIPSPVPTPVPVSNPMPPMGQFNSQGPVNGNQQYPQNGNQM